jgi:hypothetical protein
MWFPPQGAPRACSRRPGRGALPDSLPLLLSLLLLLPPLLLGGCTPAAPAADTRSAEVEQQQSAIQQTLYERDDALLRFLTLVEGVGPILGPPPPSLQDAGQDLRRALERSERARTDAPEDLIAADLAVVRAAGRYRRLAHRTYPALAEMPLVQDAEQVLRESERRLARLRQGEAEGESVVPEPRPAPDVRFAEEGPAVPGAAESLPLPPVGHLGGLPAPGHESPRP